MIAPKWKEIKNIALVFLKRENFSWRIIARPRQLIKIIIKYKYAHFFIVGVGGVALALITTWTLVTFVLGMERYFAAYLVGVGVALAFNFTMYSIIIFRTSRQHAKRFFVFIVYNVIMTAVQAFVVHTVTPIFGVEWYLLVITGVVFVFSFLNFALFKLSLFREYFSP